MTIVQKLNHIKPSDEAERFDPYSSTEVKCHSKSQSGSNCPISRSISHIILQGDTSVSRLVRSWLDPVSESVTFLSDNEYIPGELWHSQRTEHRIKILQSRWETHFTVISEDFVKLPEKIHSSSSILHQTGFFRFRLQSDNIKNLLIQQVRLFVMPTRFYKTLQGLQRPTKNMCWPSQSILCRLCPVYCLSELELEKPNPWGPCLIASTQPEPSNPPPPPSTITPRRPILTLTFLLIRAINLQQAQHRDWSGTWLKRNYTTQGWCHDDGEGVRWPAMVRRCIKAL